MAEVPPKLQFLLSNDVEVIRLVLRHLHMRDLAIAGMVCKLWHNEAKRLKVDTSVCVSTNNYNEVKSDLYFSKATCSHAAMSPMVNITVMDYGVYDRHWYFLENKHTRQGLNKLPKYKKSNVHHSLKQALPQDCASLLIQRPSALIKFYGTQTNPEEKLLGYVSFGFPRIPGVKISVFDVDSEQRKQDLAALVDVDFSYPIKHVTVIMCNKADHCMRKATEVLGYLERDQTHKLSSTLCLMEGLYESQDCKYQTDYLKIIVFSGEILSSNVQLISSPDSFEGSFLELKRSLKHPIFRHNSCGFFLYSRRDVDVVKMLQEYEAVFPNTVLLAIKCEQLFDMKHAPIECPQLNIVSWN